MGLSAAQARLLTITARKSDCEFKSMGLSHEKIALSRKMTDISNEYQNSLNLTKIVYDFYGNGDTSLPLSYNLLMTPSQYNGYMPMITTDLSGKVVLDSKYARAAEAAGIPREGLGSLPSMEVRNKFIQGLADSGYITQAAADTYKGVEYSPDIGLGTTDLITANSQEVTMEELYDMFEDINFSFNLSDSKFAKDDGRSIMVINGNYDTSKKLSDYSDKISMKDLLTNDYSVLSAKKDSDGDYACVKDIALNISHLSVWEDMFAAFAQVLGGSSLNEAALDYATSKIRGMLYFSDEQYKTYEGSIIEGTMAKPTEADPCDGWGSYKSEYKKTSNGQYGKARRRLVEAGHGDDGLALKDCIGYATYDSRNSGGLFGWRRSQVDATGISISNIAKAFLTYFYQYINGVKSKYAITNDNGMDVGGGKSSSHGRYNTVSGEARSVNNNKLIDPNDTALTFEVFTDTGLNTDQALMTGFYDALFNQICLRGWLEDENVNDTEYLQEKYKNGMMYWAACAEDGFYYQENYGTNSYIKEVADDEVIAKAEAKYNNEKQKINHKEEIIDMKMKNLDTEITSLTTEYDTVKSLISKNIERGFKRYDA